MIKTVIFPDKTRIKVSANTASKAIKLAYAKKYGLNKSKDKTIPLQKKVLIHRHEYGTSISFCNLKNFSNEDCHLTEDQAVKLAKLCDLDFEPNKGEELDLIDVPTGTIPTITKEMLNG